jgi:hypothetical protein
MNILNDKTDISFVSNTETEQVQQEKQEYYLLGTFMRTKGLNLFYYNPANGEIKEAVIKYSDTLHLYKLPDKWITVDWEYQKCTVDDRVMYFECLNLKTAIERVRRFKNGTIKELCNLKVPNPEGIKFF